MQTLSKIAVVAEYNEHVGTQVSLGKAIVTVLHYTNESRRGNCWDGLKFGRTSYGYLVRKFKTRGPKYSPDHGATWYDSFADMKKQRASKVKLTSSLVKEFAFDSIQHINREYDRNFQWRG